MILQTLFASTICPLAYRTFVLAVRFPYVKVQIEPLKLIELHCIKRSWAWKPMKINCSFDLRQEKLNRKIICWAVRLCEGLNRVRWAALFPVWIGQESKIPTPLNGLSWILASDIKLLTVTLYSNAFPLYSFFLSLSQGIFSIFKLPDH